MPALARALLDRAERALEAVEAVVPAARAGKNRGGLARQGDLRHVERIGGRRDKRRPPPRRRGAPGGSGGAGRRGSAGDRLLRQRDPAAAALGKGGLRLRRLPRCGQRRRFNRRGARHPRASRRRQAGPEHESKADEEGGAANHGAHREQGPNQQDSTLSRTISSAENGSEAATRPDSRFQPFSPI